MVSQIISLGTDSILSCVLVWARSPDGRHILLLKELGLSLLMINLVLIIVDIVTGDSVSSRGLMRR